MPVDACGVELARDAPAPSIRSVDRLVFAYVLHDTCSVRDDPARSFHSWWLQVLAGNPPLFPLPRLGCAR